MFTQLGTVLLKFLRNPKHMYTFKTQVKFKPRNYVKPNQTFRYIIVIALNAVATLCTESTVLELILAKIVA